MADVKQTRQRFVIAAIAMLVLDAVCIAVVLSPIGRGSRAGRQNEAQLWSELQTKTRQALPLHGLDAKIVSAKQQIADFYAKRFPDAFAVIPTRLTKLASEHGVTLSAAQYYQEDTDIPGLRKVHVQAAIDGDYEKEAQFINAVERDPVFFIIDSVALGRQQKGGVHLQIAFETYVRSQDAS